MQNGVNGAGAQAGAPHTVQVNPQQAAAFALQFLPRVPHTHAEREAFDMATMFLQAIASGQVQLVPAQPQAQAPALDAPAPTQ